MASDNLNQVGRYMRRANKHADLALKRNFSSLAKRDRARDTVSAVYRFRMTIQSEGTPVSIDINFNKPPPDDCAADCYATACQDFALSAGGHSITVENPYQDGTVRVFENGDPLEQVQWYEENSSGGQVYVQSSGSSVVVVCYTYIIC